MKKIKYLLLAISTPLLFTSCETVDFGTTNDNPNGPITAVPSQLLTNAEVTIGGIVGSTKGTLYTQHLAEGQYPDLSRYSASTSSYSAYYTGALTDLNKIISFNQNADTKAEAAVFGYNDNQIAVAKILKAHILHVMTDRWGAIPLSEAFQGIENPKPKFDTQEEVYNAIFLMLEEALSQIDTAEKGPKGDVILGGKMNRWIMFANSVKMTMALRISDVNPSLAKSKFEEVVASGVYIKTNADNILFSFGTDENSDSPWYQSYVVDGRTDYILSEKLVNSLSAKLDPRLFKYGEESADGVNANPVYPDNADAKYVGAKVGKVNGNVTDYNLPASNLVTVADYKIPVFSSWQMKFALAEAKSLGWNVTGTVASLYKEGISDSMTYWGVDDDAIRAYQDANVYSSVNDIAYEKWVSFFMLQPYEAWAEWRRLDFPVLTPAEEGVEDSIPLRDAYSTSIIDNNKVNYDKMISAQGPDLLSTKLWWDVN